MDSIKTRKVNVKITGPDDTIVFEKPGFEVPEDILMKKCIICKTEKSLLEFPRNKYLRDGFRNQCKECRNTQTRECYRQSSLRLCRGCQQEKTMINFIVIKTGQYSWTCNSCKHGIETKACTKCHVVQSKENFTKGNGEFSRRGDCKKCTKIADRSYKAQYAKQYQKNNKQKIREYQRNYKRKNKNKLREKQKQYRSTQTYQDKVRVRDRQRYKNDIEYKIACCIRGRLSRAIKQNNKGGSAIKELGCSILELKKHLESKFYSHPVTSEEMIWENHKLDGWHIDHVIPLANFDLTQLEEVKKACYYTNLQPLWAEENQFKGGKVDNRNQEN